MWRPAVVVATAVLIVVAAVVAVFRPWEDDDPSAVAATPRTAVAYAVGDIARCDGQGDEQTAAIVEQEPGAVVLALGDVAYDSGTPEDFRECYDPSWGSLISRTHPVPGNHEYRTDDAAPYYDYFGSRAGTRGQGWYSFDLGEWHVVALNSNCDDVGCDVGSDQERWLREDLEANDSKCTVAFWHAPRFSSGARHGGTRSVEDLWQVLLDNDVEMLLSAHEHLYERTAPLNADGEVDEAAGVRQFVVGTGGGNLYELGPLIPGSEATVTGEHGLLRLALEPDGYTWEFVGVDADSPTDQGSARCR